MTVRWKLGEVLEVTIEGKVLRHRVSARAGSGFNLVAENDGAARWFAHTALGRMWAAGELRRVRDPEEKLNLQQRRFVSRSMDTLSESERAHVKWLLPYTNAVKRSSTPIGTSSKQKLQRIIDRVAEEFGHAKKPHWRTIGKHVRAMRVAGADGRWLAPRVSARGNPKARFGGFEPTIEAALREHVLIANKQPLTDVQATLQHKLNTYNMMMPSADRVQETISVRTVQRRVAALPTDEKTRAWEGPHAARQKHRHVGVGPQADHPLQRVEIDHNILDVIVVHPVTGTALGRPCLTAAIDKFSRMVVGFHVGFEAPSYNAVMLCLRQLIMPKVALLEQYGLALDAWPCEGVPETIVVDNGMEFHSKDFDVATNQLGIDVQICAAGHPEQKGTIERWFRTLNSGLIHALPGTTKSNPRSKGEYDSAKHAVMTIAKSVFENAISSQGQRRMRVAITAMTIRVSATVVSCS